MSGSILIQGLPMKLKFFHYLIFTIIYQDHLCARLTTTVGKVFDKSLISFNTQEFTTTANHFHAPIKAAGSHFDSVRSYHNMSEFTAMHHHICCTKMLVRTEHFGHTIFHIQMRFK